MSKANGMNVLITMATALPMAMAASCGRSTGKSTRSAAADTTASTDVPDTTAASVWQRTWWLEKAARALLGGHELTDPHLRAELLASSDTDAVQKLIADPRFYDTVADFATDYLGMKSARYEMPRSPASVFATSLADLPQAVEAARSVEGDKDIFAALTSPGVFYLAPTGDVAANAAAGAPPDARERRLAFYDKFRRQLALVAALLRAGRSPTQDELCLFDGTSVITTLTNNFFLSKVATDLLVNDQVNSPMRPFFRCFGPYPNEPALTLDLVTAASGRLEQLIPYLRSLDSDRYHPEHVLDLRQLDWQLAGARFKPQNEQPDAWFWDALPNSSTNRNRRRAAYVLRRFFCDDLTPIEVVAGAHASGRHAADPACQACHYKLDPLAGFFRSRGQGGIPVASDTITFDDGATATFADYVKEWQAPAAAAAAAAAGTGAGAEHPWAVAYVRSSTQPALSDYGDHPGDPELADLSAIIRRAPEVKECFVRRLYGYFTGADQAYDPAYLAHETQLFRERYAVSPGLAVKEAVARVILSRTFRTEDPASEACYDTTATPAAAAGRPPCRVAAIFSRYCASCHNGVAGAGGLDLTRWVVPANGGDATFPHQGAHGEQLSRAVSFSRISARLSSVQPSLRMPLGQELPQADLAALFLWLNTQPPTTGL